MTANTFTLKREIGNTPANAYYMFTHEHGWREWFCDSAWAQQREEGRLLLNWQRPLWRDLFVLARFAKLEADKRIELEWEANIDPSRGSVVVEIAATDGGCSVSMTQTFPEGATDESMKRQKTLWENGLENLQSALETGVDLRLARAPMLGIIISVMDDATQKRLGLPDKNGTPLVDTIEGLGARAAGLVGGDVIVALDDLTLNPTFGIFDFMASKKAGETVKVDFYRDRAKQTVNMTLSPRILSEVPPAARDLAARLREVYDEMETDLDEALADVSEATASMAAPDGGWSVKEILAHLVLGERDQQNAIAQQLSDDVAVNALQNQDARVRALVSTRPTLAEIRAEVSRSYQETVAFVENLPDTFVSRRSSYWQLAQGMLQGGYHLQDHLAQIKALTAVAAPA